MNQDIQNKIDTAVRLWLKKEYGHTANSQNCHSSFVAYIAGANHILSYPELMKEAMVDMLDWLSNQTYYEPLGGGNWSITSEEPENKDINSKQIADLYVDHLKSVSNE